VSITASEPLSPELVLVSPELRTLAIGAMPDLQIDALIVSTERPSPLPTQRSRRATAARMGASLILYACWQAFIGALFGLAAFAAFSALLLSVAAMRS
jgi:hypothetical protein